MDFQPLIATYVKDACFFFYQSHMIIVIKNLIVDKCWVFESRRSDIFWNV